MDLNIDKIRKDLEFINNDDCIRFKESMKKHTTFKVGGEVDILVEPRNSDEIVNLIHYFKYNNIPYYILGNGSNVLVKDEGIKGAIIKISKNFSHIDIKGDKVRAMAGATLSALSKRAIKESLTGLEFSSGIPGTLGGGVCMNAGAYGGELKDVILEAKVLDEDYKLKTLSLNELKLGYRSSIIWEKKYIVLEVLMQLNHGLKMDIENRVRVLDEKRISKQPLNYPSAGSVFKRPKDNFAGKLIEDAGLKGYSIGGAQVSNKHSGFIINKGDAKAKDVIELIEFIQNRVYNLFGIKLEREVKILD